MYYVIVKENIYVDANGWGGYKLGDIVWCSREDMGYGGFVVANGFHKEHSVGHYYWSKEDIEDCLRPVEWLDLFNRYAEFESAGHWRYSGLIVRKDHKGKRGWYVPGIDPYALGEADKPFRTMRDAMQWIEKEYGDVKQWA